MTWETVIGLEVHAQLATNSKIFSGAATKFGAEPNTQACLVDLGFPGVLPVLNRSAVTMAIRLGLGIHAEIAPISVFARKNYFYPDLPKGYQISQFDLPVVKNGYLTILGDDGLYRKINIVRAHLEEDAGKSLHEDFDGYSGIDLNRAGTPLIEIVSAPELRSAQEAVNYLKALHTLVKYLEICDGNMQEGSFRCDANVSIRKKGDLKLGTRTELKNINSFRYVERAIEFEIERQITELENGGKIIQETRLYDPVKNETRALRSKEEANDYRYFPDPDLLPLKITPEDIAKVEADLPELPEKKYMRFMEEHQLSDYDARVLTSTRELAQYFENTLNQTSAPAKLAANWITTELMGVLNKNNLDIQSSPIAESTLAALLTRIADETISGKIAKTLFEMLLQGEVDVDALIEKHDLKQITDTVTIESFIDELLEKSPQQLADYRSGKEKLFGYFVGQAMKLSQGKIHPEKLNELLKKKLS